MLVMRHVTMKPLPKAAERCLRSKTAKNVVTGKGRPYKRVLRMLVRA